MKQRSFFIESPVGALAATLFLPTQARAALLLIPPLAEERKGVLPVFVQCARTLANQGVASLLFDFCGSGDAEGDFAEQLPESLENGCESAWQWLTQKFAPLPCHILGARSGALLALGMARRHPNTASCTLWAPVAGVDFVHQLLQRRMVNDMIAYGKARAQRAELEQRWQKGETLDLDGYEFNARLHAWLQTHSVIGEATTNDLTATPVLCLSGGHDTKTATLCHGYDKSRDLRFPPFWNTVGHVDVTPLIDATKEWLSARMPTNDHPVDPEAIIGELPHSAPFAQFVTIGAQGEISAIFDLPAGRPKAGALFLHGWSGDRTGPHRLFVQYARELANQGVLTMRLDFFGRGLSGGAASEASIARMAEDAQAGLAALRAKLPPDAPIRVVAICSGCKVAITLAAHNPWLEKLILWSAESMGDLRSRSTGRRKTLQMLLSYALKLRQPETWRKIFKGKVQANLVTKALVKHETRSAQEALWESGVLERFRAFRNPILFVFGGSDPDAPGSSQAYQRFCKKNGQPCKTYLIANAGHSFYGVEWTRELLRITESF